MEQMTIIVAGGSGTRMNTEIPKQFLLLNDEPVLMRTIRAFNSFSPGMEIVVVLPADQVKYWETLCRKQGFSIPHTIVEGGETRHHSVKNAINRIKPGMLVAIHDGVRPLVSQALIRTCFDTASVLGNAVPATGLSDSIRRIEGDSNFRVDRSLFRMVQTPQVFSSDLLIEAFRQDYDPVFTDEATLVERAGHKIHLVKGQPDNIKITTTLDMCIASAIIEAC
ncbi:MAG: 2-C-methyl-D-erythritol 4-phosphate cytidylyltransferase [Marinilabiliales bacterium]|nr:MAG: 2-C-methyl-D-erythritol 4-phosphate cytidylyltransferase [Marinilabiliales bacterium]